MPLVAPSDKLSKGTCTIPFSKFGMCHNPEFLQEVVTEPVASIDLSIKEHWGNKDHQAEGGTSPDREHDLGTGTCSPAVHKVAEAKEGEVLEHHADDEDLVAEAAVGVQDIVGCQNGDDGDAKYHQSLCRRTRVVRRAAVGEVAKGDQAAACGGGHKHQWESIFRLVDTSVLMTGPCNKRIVDEGYEQSGQHA
jgi:hypothetical protein